MKRVVDSYFGLLKLTVVLCLAGMVILVFGNVVLRYVFNSGITVAEEVSRLLFLYCTFLGATVAMRERLHLGVDSLTRRLPALGKRLCLVSSLALMLFCCVLVIQGSWAQVLINTSVKMPVTGLSVGVVYAAGLIFSVSAALIVLYDLYIAVLGRDATDAAQLHAERDRAGEGHPTTQELALARRPS
ncbi:TRAP transporter small permease [Hydrogenophaga aquatica]